MQSNTVTIEPHIQFKIDKLIRVYRTAEFDSLFNALTDTLTTPQKFLIKQELARLFRPCIKTIDLSTQVKYPVSEFKWGKMRFYLDEISKRIFIQTIDIFGGEYTEGVYETVLSPSNYLQYEKQFQQEEQLSAFKVQITSLGQTTKRLEERLFCAKPVIIHTSENIQLDAVTSNISRSGCLIRIKEIHHLKIDQLIRIDFSSLTEQFKMSQSPVCSYQIKFISNQPDKDELYRVGVQLNEGNHEWMQFLDRYVLANRSSFKVDISNAKELTESRILENHLLKNTQWLPIFAQLKNNKVKQVKYCLTNKNNSNVSDFFEDKESSNRLNSIIFKLWPSLNKTDSNILLVGKLQNQNKTQFIAATLSDLISQKLFNTFVDFAKLKGEINVYQVRTKALTEDILNQLKLNWFKSSNEANKALDPLTLTNQLIYLFPLIQVKDYIDTIQAQKIEKHELAKLNQFLCPKIKNQTLSKFDVVAKCARSEQRFFLNSPASFSYQNRIINAQLIDISIKGLSVKLSEIPAYLELGALLPLNIDKLEQFNKIVTQTDAKYKLVGINEHKNTLHLQLTDNENNRPLLSFMQALIKQHRSKLKINDQYDRFIILQKALCIAFISEFPSCAFGVVRSNKALFKTSRLLTADNDAPELDFLEQLQKASNINELTLFPLLKGNEKVTYANIIQDFIRHKQFSHDSFLFITNKHQQMEKRIVFSEQNIDQLKAAITDQNHKTLSSVQLSIYPISNPEIETVADNLRYIARYNRHQAEQLKRFADKLIGMVELVNDESFWQLIQTKQING
ncbi:PilZ domain-containing protein [Catenovulum sp. 2E275]|uniref:PilZ domain-containing protein n=1 Tax=Catenovulum sp. 2E275 TaxID=2980497 RepID=UPI0021D2957F|nr:PilZ domain-containing protein [Catenovulum sp. 2E275]MCU4676465.1 PilZ domain-containing protein [Catenovulum sp. 2E275]